jgi:P4 family phage/plasmid primase-like protien
MASIQINQTELKDKLSRLPEEWALVAVNGKKAPYMREWQHNPLTRAEIEHEIDSGQCKAIGVLCGEKSGGLLFIDQDGASCQSKLNELSGGEALPRTVTVTSGKEGRSQSIYRVPEEYWDRIATKRVKTGVEGEQVEFRWIGCQSVIAGAHPETNGYYWLPGKAPDECEVADAPDWVLNYLVNENQKQQKAFVPAANEDNYTEHQSADNKSEVQPKHESASKNGISDSFNSEIDAEVAHYLGSLAKWRCDDYNMWIAVGMALKSIDESLLSAWIEWSKQSGKFKQGECEKKWDSFPTKNNELWKLCYWARRDSGTQVLPKSDSNDVVPVALPPHSEIADRIAEIHQNLVLFNEERAKWLGYYPNGIFKELNINVVRRYITDYLKSQGYIHKKYDIESIDELLKQRLYIPKWPAADPNLIPFRNGVLDATKMEFKPHSPTNMLTWSLDFDYDPVAEYMPIIDKFLDEASGNRSERRNVMIAFLAAILRNIPNLQKFVHCIGDGGNGKGVFTELAMMMVGSSGCHSISLKSLCEKDHGSAACDGKRLVIFADQDKYKGDLQTFKNLTGGDRIYANPKYIQPYSFKFDGIVIVTSNSDIFVNHGDWLSRRRIIVQFEFKPANPDPKLIEKIKPEIPALINHLLRLPDEWIRQVLTGISESSEFHRAERDALIDANSVAQWLDEHCSIGQKHKDSFHTNKELYDDYCKFCDESNLKPLDKSQFGKELTKLGKTTFFGGIEPRKVGGERSYIGLKLRDRQSGNGELPPVKPTSR